METKRNSAGGRGLRSLALIGAALLAGAKGTAKALRAPDANNSIGPIYTGHRSHRTGASPDVWGQSLTCRRMVRKNRWLQLRGA